MTISLDKTIYSKDAIYKSLEVWNEYLSNPKISESGSKVSIIVNNEAVSNNTINEFLNYVLDLTSSLELA